MRTHASSYIFGYITGFSYNDVPFDMFIIYDDTACAQVRARERKGERGTLCIFLGNIFDSFRRFK